jgi:hypothetical protein
MAKRKYGKKMNKVQPAVTRLWFHIADNNNFNYIDMSLAASAVNRRFYRQGLNWAVASMTLHTNRDASGSFTVQKVPDTWVAQNAHTKAKRLWMKSQDQVLDNDPTVKGRYRDFKVYLDEFMTTSTIQPFSTSAAANNTIMLPVASNNSPARVGEWEYSTIQLPTDGGSAPPTEIRMFMVGADSTTTDNKSIIVGYANSRSRPTKHDPNIPSEEGWMNEVFDVAENLDEIRDDLATQNDVPPYRVGDANDVLPSQDNEFYPGGGFNMSDTALHERVNVTTTTIGGTTHITGGQFGCGLIKFDFQQLTMNGNTYLCVDLVPGSHKGYLAEEY